MTPSGTYSILYLKLLRVKVFKWQLIYTIIIGIKNKR